MKTQKTHKRWRNPICPKISYMSFEKAFRSQKRIVGKGDDEGLDVYLCRRCGRYHLGHPREWKESQIPVEILEQMWSG